MYCHSSKMPQKLPLSHHVKKFSSVQTKLWVAKESRSTPQDNSSSISNTWIFYTNFQIHNLAMSRQLLSSFHILRQIPPPPQKKDLKWDPEAESSHPLPPTATSPAAHEISKTLQSSEWRSCACVHGNLPLELMKAPLGSKRHRKKSRMHFL